MTHKQYFRNFFFSLAASLSDSDFLAFVSTVLDNLKRDPVKYAVLIAQLTPLHQAQAEALQQRGMGGQSVTGSELQRLIRELLNWVRLTNIQKVYPAFPERSQPERIDILPGGMDAFYQADQDEIEPLFKGYTDKLRKYADQLGPELGTQGNALHARLVTALQNRRQEESGRSTASASLDQAEQNSCHELFRIYGTLLMEFYRSPETAYAFFPFPDSRSEEEEQPTP